MAIAPLSRSQLDADPLHQFEAWFEAACAAGVRVPEAVALATATPCGTPSLRMVLMKGADERGFTFYSNYESRKGRELAANARAALLFYWRELGRQIRIEGTVEGLDPAESDDYFQTRPAAARLSAWASRQSEPVPSRAELETRVGELEKQLGDDPPRPPFWGGFLLRPEAYEFWQHRDDRLHDRFRYRRGEAGAWVVERLAP